jgi:hypothetical protein
MKDNNKYKILLDSVYQKFNTFISADDAIDQKAGTLMGFEITLLVGYLTLIASKLEGVKLIEGIIGSVILVISTALLIIINWSKSYSAVSVKLKDHAEYYNKDEKQLLMQMIDDGEAAIEKNNIIRKAKSKKYKIAIISLVISSIILILSKFPKIYV